MAASARLAGPKRESHHSFDESVDEPASLIESETVDVEEANPSDGNEPVQNVQDQPQGRPPAFEE